MQSPVRTFISTHIASSLLIPTFITSAVLLGPTIAHAQARPAAGAAAPKDTAPRLTSTAPPGRQSWFSDRRDFHLGDIVTILVDEYTLTSLDKQVDATDNRRRDLNFDTGSGSGNNFGMGSNNGSTTRGRDARTNRLTTEMAARVVEIGPNGTMRLEGTKALNVEKTQINLTLSGWVRALDVTQNNAVQSYTMADAKLDYQAKGPLGNPKGGIIGKLLGKFWP
jgi:flagellar L-ring protein precursor FlgH